MSIIDDLVLAKRAADVVTGAHMTAPYEVIISSPVEKENLSKDFISNCMANNYIQ